MPAVVRIWNARGAATGFASSWCESGPARARGLADGDAYDIALVSLEGELVRLTGSGAVDARLAAGGAGGVARSRYSISIFS
jgi:hypothetical protein